MNASLMQGEGALLWTHDSHGHGTLEVEVWHPVISCQIRRACALHALPFSVFKQQALTQALYGCGPHRGAPQVAACFRSFAQGPCTESDLL